MKLISTLFVFSLISILKLKAKSDLRNGYVVKNNNDTIYGMIDYSLNRTNDKRCTFKKEIDSESQIFNPSEIKCFRFLNSKYYVSKVVKIEGIVNNAFVEFLINGKVNLYYLKRIDQYYLEKDDQLYELKNTIEVISKNGFMYEQQKKEYVGMMTYLLQDANIQNYINKASLDHKSLIKV